MTSADPIWNLRYAQKIEECRMALAGLKMQLRLPAGYPRSVSAREVLSHAKDREATLQVLLLMASLQRAIGEKKASLETLKEIFTECCELDLPVPFELPFENGLSHYSVADYSSALNCFLSARAIAKNPNQKLLAVANAVFCLDFLGLPFSQTLEEAKELLEELKATGPLSTVAAQFESKLQTLALFMSLRSGQLHSFYAREASTSSQSQYLRAWVSGLPYHAYHDREWNQTLETLALENSQTFKKGYRLRTLQGLLHPEDDCNFHEPEFCERLYLWTWWWLKDPQKFSVQKVLLLLKSVDLSRLASRVAMDDFQKLRNALRWLALFDGSTYQKLESVIEAAKPHTGQEHELFQYESELLSYLRARREKREIEAQDFQRQLLGHPLSQASTGLYLGRIVEALSAREVPEFALSRLINALRSLLPSADPAPSLAAQMTLEVDLQTFRLEHKPSGKVQISQPLATAVGLLKRRTQMGCAEFLAACFGIDDYEPLLHDPKIFNLLARIRRLLPTELKVGVKTGTVYSTGIWQNVIVKPAAEGANLKSQPEWRSFLVSAPARRKEKNVGLQPRVMLKKLEGHARFTREEIQSLTGTSRSSANRLITTWLERGWVRREGRARCTSYRLVDVFVEKESYEVHG